MDVREGELLPATGGPPLRELTVAIEPSLMLENSLPFDVDFELTQTLPTELSVAASWYDDINEMGGAAGMLQRLRDAHAFENRPGSHTSMAEIAQNAISRASRTATSTWSTAHAHGFASRSTEAQLDSGRELDVHSLQPEKPLWLRLRPRGALAMPPGVLQTRVGYIVMAYIVMAYIVMAYIVMALHIDASNTGRPSIGDVFTRLVARQGMRPPCFGHVSAMFRPCVRPAMPFICMGRACLGHGSSYIVRIKLYSYGLYSHGLYSYGLYSYGLYSHGHGV